MLSTLFEEVEADASADIGTLLDMLIAGTRNQEERGKCAHCTLKRMYLSLKRKDSARSRERWRTAYTFDYTPPEVDEAQLRYAQDTRDTILHLEAEYKKSPCICGLSHLVTWGSVALTNTSSSLGVPNVPVH